MGLLDDAKEKAKALAGLLASYYQTGAQMYFPNEADVKARPDLAKGLLQFVPGPGDAISGYDAIQSAKQGNYGEAALNGVGLLPFIPALGGLTVFHGSPHKFSKFDMSKIGTGEGAQAYGHGLYMAESPKVAKEYADKLAQGKPYLDGKPFDQALKELPISDQAKRILEFDMANHDPARIERFARQGHPEYVEAWNILKYAENNPGTMYKVDIPDEAVSRMLDWDKPLSQQAPEVQRAAKDFFARNPEAGALWKGAEVSPRNMTGQQLYQKLSQGSVNGKNYVAGGDISKALRDAGITGIRYLDGGSRGAGSGTSNYVLFSDQLPRIIETNGVPTGQVPWKPGEWK